MPVIKLSSDYIDRLHSEIQEHYGVNIPKRIIKTILREYNHAVYDELKKAKKIITPDYKIFPILPRLRLFKKMYYNQVEGTSSEMSYLKKVARNK